MNIASKIIVFLLILFLIYYLIKQIFTVPPLSTLSAANVEQTISADQLSSTSTGVTNNCTYSIWFYVNDWSVDYGEEKIIFEKMSDSSTTPDLKLALGDYDNSLVVSANVISSQSSYNLVPNAALLPSETLHPLATVSEITNSLGCENICNNTGSCLAFDYDQNQNICYPIANNSSSATSILGDGNGPYGTSAYTNFISGIKDVSSHTCTVPNIPIQKWVNVVLSISTTTLDVYIDGKLVKTCLMNGVFNISNTLGIKISPGGKGFNGWNSKFQYWEETKNPQQIWNIYKQGFGGPASNNGYKVTLAVYKGDVEKTSITI